MSLYSTYVRHSVFKETEVEGHLSIQFFVPTVAQQPFYVTLCAISVFNYGVSLTKT
jgi:hypothetical protein